MNGFQQIDKLSGVAGAAALVVLAVAPLVFPGNYLIGVLTVAAIYGIWAVSWDFMSGLTAEKILGTHYLLVWVLMLLALLMCRWNSDHGGVCLPLCY